MLLLVEVSLLCPWCRVHIRSLQADESNHDTQPELPDQRDRSRQNTQTQLLCLFLFEELQAYYQNIVFFLLLQETAMSNTVNTMAFHTA